MGGNGIQAQPLSQLCRASLPARLLLYCAVATLLAPAPAIARTLNGGTHTVLAGDVEDFWTVRGGALLTLGAGARASTIDVADSALTMLPGSVTSGLVHMGNFSPLEAQGATLAGGLRLQVASASLRDSTVDNGSGANGVLIQSLGFVADLHLYNSQVHGHDGAGTDGVGVLSNGKGLIEANAGSLIHGDTNGVRIQGATMGSRTDLLVDAARVEGGSAAAVRVGGGSTAVDAYVVVRNGGQLSGGNGVLLEVGGANPSQATLTLANTVLSGALRADAGHQLHLLLDDDAGYRGRVSGLSSATLSSGGTWTLIEDSQAGALTLNAGGVMALGDGTAFHTLTVTDDHLGAGGTLLFHTVLGDDASPTDRLVVQGDTRGQTLVAVQNVGGRGADTVDGIRLIQVDGASDGQFDLLGRAVAGAHEYFLVKGGAVTRSDGDWYLRSEIPTPPDPCVADPTGPGCVITLPEQCELDPTLPQCQPPLPVLRPEVGAYLANQAAAAQMFGLRLDDRPYRIADSLSGRGAWARVARSQARYGVVGNQLGVTGATDVLQVGTDLLAWGADSRGRFGAMLGGGRARTTVTSRLTGYTATGRVDGQAAGLYASWLQDPAQAAGLYVDGWVQHATFKNTVQGDALARERYDSRTTLASVEAGYSIPLLDSAGTAMFIEPQLQLTYADWHAGRHVEANGTLIDGSRRAGLTSRMGLRLFGHANTSIGNRVQPFVALNWLHGRDDNNLRFNGERLQGGLPRDRYEAGAGAQLQLGRRWTGWGTLALQRGNSGYRQTAAQLGLRAAW